MSFHRAIIGVLLAALTTAYAVPCRADTSPSDSYLWFQYKLATAKSRDDLGQIRKCLAADAGDALDKIIQQTGDGTLDVEPLTFTRMVFETSKYPPSIVKSKQ